MTFKHAEVIALIPARGGSKGILRKNLRILFGKPLLLHTIHAAQASSLIDRIFVSSDDDDIIDLAVRSGVQVIKRTATASTDTATANDVLFDFISQMQISILEANPYIVYLQPTSPLRTGEHIDQAFSQMFSVGRDKCISVTESPRTPFKTFIIDNKGDLEPLFNEGLLNSNRQTLPTAYHSNGAIYIFPINDFLNQGMFPINGVYPFIMTEWESIDIDSEADLKMLEDRCQEV